MNDENAMPDEIYAWPDSEITTCGHWTPERAMAEQCIKFIRSDLATKPAITREQVAALRRVINQYDSDAKECEKHGYNAALDAVIAMLFDQKQPDPSNKKVCASQTGSSGLPPDIAEVLKDARDRLEILTLGKDINCAGRQTMRRIDAVLTQPAANVSGTPEILHSELPDGVSVRDLMRAAYLEGWNQSTEGFNHEYPCDSETTEEINRRSEAYSIAACRAQEGRDE